MYATNHYETQILNSFNNITAVAPSALFVGLYLSNPTETGVGGTEISFTGYTRPQITFTAPFADGGNISITNASDLLWNSAPNDVGQVRFIGISDSASPGSGNMWLYGELSVPLDIKANQATSIATGDIMYFLTGNFSRTFKTRIFNLLRGTNLTGFTPYLSLFDGDPENGGGELSGEGYARVAVPFTAPEEQPGGQSMIQNSAVVRFQSPKSVWGLWAWDGLRDGPLSGDLVLKTVNPTPENIQKNYVPTVDIGAYRVMIN